jgi:hypothetical protein
VLYRAYITSLTQGPESSSVDPDSMDNPENNEDSAKDEKKDIAQVTRVRRVIGFDLFNRLTTNYVDACLRALVIHLHKQTEENSEEPPEWDENHKKSMLDLITIIQQYLLRYEGSLQPMTSYMNETTNRKKLWHKYIVSRKKQIFLSIEDCHSILSDTLKFLIPSSNRLSSHLALQGNRPLRFSSSEEEELQEMLEVWATLMKTSSKSSKAYGKIPLNKYLLFLERLFQLESRIV